MIYFQNTPCKIYNHNQTFRSNFVTEGLCQKVNFKGSSKNVIPAKAGIYKLLTSLDSRLRGSDKFGIIRGCLNSTI